jgi:hypothetical protein
MKKWVMRKSILKCIRKVIMYTNTKHYHLTGRKDINRELIQQDQDVPLHLDLPTLSEILKMHQKPPGVMGNDKQEDYGKQGQAFTFLVEHLLGHIIGKREWDMMKCFHVVSEWVSISDEAYTLLLLENVYEKWLAIKPDITGEKQTSVRGEYTDPEKGASNEKYKGWTVKGIEQYNELYKSVEIIEMKSGQRQWR